MASPIEVLLLAQAVQDTAVYTTAAVNVASTTPATLASWSVAANVPYRVRAGFTVQNVANTAGITIGFAGANVTLPQRVHYLIVPTVSGSSFMESVRIGTVTTGNLTSGTIYGVHAEGVLTFSAAETLTFQVAMAASGDTWTMEDSAWFEVFPLSAA